MRELVYELKGLSCASCAGKIEEDVGKLSGVSSARLSFAVQKLDISLEAGAFPEQIASEVRKTVHSIEPGVEILDVKNRTQDIKTALAAGRMKSNLIQLATGVLLFAAGISLRQYNEANLALLLAAWLLSGFSVLAGAARNIARGRIFDENFLMTVATAGAIATGQYAEAAAVMLFYKTGMLFQNLAVERSRRSIKALLDLKPDYANLITESGVKRVDPASVNIGERLLVKPGERIPLDCFVEEGESFIDTSALTGEPVPRRVKPGDRVFGGCINKNGLLKLKAETAFEKSEVSRILDLVQNAASKKAKTENFITGFAAYYTPAVVFSAVLVAVLPPLLSGSMDFNTWIYRALIFLVVSCPCALVVSIPLTWFAGIGKASSRGILVKGGSYLDALSKVDTVVFDKTGTLTQGVFSVSGIQAEGVTPEKLLEYAALAELNSSHPIAGSIREAYGKEADASRIQSCEEIAGKGVMAKTDEGTILAGSMEFLQSKGVTVPDSAGRDGTMVYVAFSGGYLGAISVADRLKTDSKRAIEELRRAGVRHICMLTGDAQGPAESVAAELQLDEVCSSLLPRQKLDRLEAIKARSRGSVVFAGDGINDSPVLTRADVGVAMGALGSDAAIEASDVVLMTDEPSRLAEAIRIAGKTRRIAMQNIVLAIIVKIIVLALGTAGAAEMWEAVFADVGVTLLAVFNALRIVSRKTG